MEISSRLSKPRQINLVPVGEETGLVIPDEMLARLGVRQGDEVTYVETPEGIELRPYVSPSGAARE